MHRTEGLYNSSGFFINGPPGTRVEENWLNAMQEEIAYVIEQAGVTLKTAATETRDQLKLALDTLYTQLPSGTVMLFGQNLAPTGWTRKTDWANNAMLCYAATGNIAGGGSANPQSAHTHTGPSHTHTGPSHTHTGPSHTHTIATHAHTTGSHALTIAEMPAHYHDVPDYGASIGSTLGTFFYGERGGNGALQDTNRVGSTGGGDTHNHGSTGGSGTLTSAASGTANTGAGGTANTGAGGTGATGSNTAPLYQEVIAATKN